MELYLYKCNDVENKIKKTLKNELKIEFQFKENTNIMYPNILINFNFEDVENYNYCYIPILNRYFFIKNISIYRNNLIELDLYIDVLMTYKEKILNSQFHIIEVDDITNTHILNCNKKENIETQIIEVNENNLVKECNILITNSANSSISLS